MAVIISKKKNCGSEYIPPTPLLTSLTRFHYAQTCFIVHLMAVCMWWHGSTNANSYSVGLTRDVADAPKVDTISNRCI